jgi:Glycosyltransferase family 87
MSRPITITVLFLLNALILFKVLSVTSFFSPSRYQPDFDAYYHLVSDIRRGLNPYSVAYMQTLGPPLVFLYFFPFSLFSLHTAQSLNLLINLLSGYFACAVLALHLPFKNKFYVFLVLAPVLYSVFTSRYSLQIGQPHLLITLLISLVITTPRWRHLFLSALFSLKTFFILPLVSNFLSRKSYFPMFLTLLFILLVGSLVVRPSSYLSYINRLPDLKFTRITEPLTDTEYYSQSLRSTFKRLGVSSAYAYLYPALIMLAFVLSLKTRSLELAILFSLMLSPILWQHYFIALFPIYVFYLSRPKNPISNILYLISLILWFPDLRLQWAPVTITNRLLASHYFFGLVLLTLAVFNSLRYNSDTKSVLGSVVERFPDSA